ncbi:FAD-binding oxidoreductase [Frateuria aurantia]
MYTVTIQATGHHFQVDAGESILAAAERCGIRLGSDPARGVPARLMAGVCRHQGEPGRIDADGPVRQPLIELRQAVPCSDLVIAAEDVDEAGELVPRRLQVEVAAKDELAPDVTGLYLRPVPGQAPLRWLPGQYLEFILEDGRRRPFSIAGGPRLDHLIELHIRHVAGGGFTQWVHTGLEPGDTLTIEAPRGTFVPREDSDRPIIFVAGGTGFAPVKALIEYFLHRGSRRPMQLYWGARSEADLYQRDLVQAWCASAPSLGFQPCISDPAQAALAGLRPDLVHEAVLDDHPDLSGHDIYMSGPPPLIDAGRRLFPEAGLPPERLYYDTFDYAPDLLASILGARRAS